MKPVMCIVVAAKSTDADRQRDVDVGSSSFGIRKNAHEAKRRQSTGFSWRRTMERAAATGRTGRFSHRRLPAFVGAETHANAAQECSAMLVDPEHFLSGHTTFTGRPAAFASSTASVVCSIPERRPKSPP